MGKTGERFPQLDAMAENIVENVVEFYPSTTEGVPCVYARLADGTERHVFLTGAHNSGGAYIAAGILNQLLTALRGFEANHSDETASL